MVATVSPTQSAVLTALRSFILGLISCEVVQGIDNNVSMPKGGFILMAPLFNTRLSTNTHTYSDPTPTTGIRVAAQAKKYTVQLDCYGPDAEEWADILSTMLRDEYGCKALGPAVQPLHADDPKMVPLVNGEQNYEQRWVVTAELQYNPTISIAQQFFDVAEVGIYSVDKETL